MFTITANDKASILSGIVNCISSPKFKTAMLVSSRRKLIDLVYTTREILYLLDDLYGHNYRLRSAGISFSIEFKNGSLFTIRYYIPMERGCQADMIILDEFIPEEEKKYLSSYCGITNYMRGGLTND